VVERHLIVLRALSGPPETKGHVLELVVNFWKRPTSRNDGKEPEFDIGEESEETFHLDAPDPDLAALLISNRLAGK
jgi:hypothetical protein